MSQWAGTLSLLQARRAAKRAKKKANDTDDLQAESELPLPGNRGQIGVLGLPTVEGESDISTIDDGPSAARSPLKQVYYKYDPLDETAGEIRLLTLLPDSFSAKVRVVLVTEPLTIRSVPKFEALSYSWGSSDDPSTILIGESGSQTLAVTQNLAEALPYLRYEDKPRVLWIDAICVNQRDPEERGRQVRRMADIFSMATRVVVWLGPESSDSSKAIELFKEIGSTIRFDWRTRRILAISKPMETHWADEKALLPFSDDDHLAMCHLIQRSWFDRLWIWQEIHLSSKDSIMMCGKDTIYWDLFCSARICVNKKPLLASTFSIMYRKQLDSISELCQPLSPGGHSIYKLLRKTRHSKCTDPRDRIFAVLSMLKEDEKRYGVKPDYTKSSHEVFMDVVVRYLTRGGRSSLLTFVEHQHGERNPSWVPDWSVARETSPLKWDSAPSGNLRGKLPVYSHGSLQITGVPVAAVEITLELKLPERATNREVVVELKRIASRKELQRPFLGGETSLQALCRTLHGGDSFKEDYSVPPKSLSSRTPSLVQSGVTLRKILEHPDDATELVLSPEDVLFLTIASKTCFRRSIFITDAGHIGLGPRTMQTGDLVSILLRCHSAMILRPRDNNQFGVVGEAYCHGVMNGEALWGPFPPNFDFTRQHNAKGGQLAPAYINRETGIIQSEDPRLGPLPAPWKRKDHSNAQFYTWFVNEETGEELKQGNDPRVNSENVQARGVDLRIFELI